MYQDDSDALNDESNFNNEFCDVIELVQYSKEYNHRDFIVNETKRARVAVLCDPKSGNIIELVLWLDTLIHELDKETGEEILKISA